MNILAPTTSTQQKIFNRIVEDIPYAKTLGVECLWDDVGFLVVLNESDDNIGNPYLNAIHGGVTAAFMEIAATTSLSWHHFQTHHANLQLSAPLAPKTISFSVDYLRTGLHQKAFARVSLNRMGRRYASMRVEAWQDDPLRPFAQAKGHFLMPQLDL